MMITMKSTITGHYATMNLPITQAQWKEWNSPGRRLIQDVFPQLNNEQREFLMTGITQPEWDKFVKPTEDERF